MTANARSAVFAGAVFAGAVFAGAVFAAALACALLAPATAGRAYAAPTTTTLRLTVHNASRGARFAAKKRWLRATLARANALYSRARLRFVLARSAALCRPVVAMNVAQRDQLARDANRDGTVHVFFVFKLADKDRRKPDGSARLISGVHWRAGRGVRYIIVAGGTYVDTLAHELGHYLGLGHARSRVRCRASTRGCLSRNLLSRNLSRNLMASPRDTARSRLSRWQLRLLRKRLPKIARRLARQRRRR